MDIQPDLSLCLAYGGNAERLHGFLAALTETADPVACEAIVVHRANEPPPAALLRAFPEVLFYEEPDATPMRALNRALALASGRYLSLWNDSVTLKAEALHRLLTFLDDHPAVGLASPQILAEQGKALTAGRPLPGCLALLAVHAGRRKELSAPLPADNAASPLDAEWLPAAALVIRREAFEDIGLLDHEFVSLYADADYCRRARRLGWRLCCLPASTVLIRGPISPHRPPHHWGDMARFCAKRWLGL